MKTIITAAILALSTTAATAHTCGFADAEIKDYPGYATSGNTYDRGDSLFTVVADYDNSVTYHTYTNKATCKSTTVAIDTQTKDVAPVEVIEVVVAGVVTLVPVEVLDGKYVTKTKYWGDPTNSDDKKHGNFRTETTEIVYDNGVVVRHRTVTKTFKDGTIQKVVDNHRTQKSFKIRVNGDKIPSKTYETAGKRTNSNDGNWVDVKPKGFGPNKGKK